MHLAPHCWKGRQVLYCGSLASYCSLPEFQASETKYITLLLARQTKVDSTRGPQICVYLRAHTSSQEHPHIYKHTHTKELYEQRKVLSLCGPGPCLLAALAPSVETFVSSSSVKESQLGPRMHLPPPLPHIADDLREGGPLHFCESSTANELGE